MAESLKFKGRLTDLIDESDFPRAQIPALAKITSLTLSLALGYGIIPSVKSLIKLADFFDVSIPYLLGETDINDFDKADKPSTFHERFEALCEEKGLSHYKISKECYFDKSNVSKWMSKGYYPTLDILKRLCKKFEVTIDYLLGRTDYRK